MLRLLTTRDEVLTATTDDPFVDLSLPPADGLRATALGPAVALECGSDDDGRWLWVLSPGPAATTGLLAALVAETDWLTPAGSAEPFGEVSVPRHSATAARALLTDKGIAIGPPAEWEWMHTRTAPPPQPGEGDLVELHESDRDRILAILSEHSPRTFARPFEHDRQLWLAAVEPGQAPSNPATLVAVGCADHTLHGIRRLEGIATRPDRRGRGLGAAITAALTRRGLDERGACVLEMFSDNETARRVYHRLGYTTDHEWTTAALLR
ncbi:MAG: GNAT family N-acetyltransferase [Micrococcales bacterium]|nr:GNAT family N-acetyltransferase [Micrococcales bacterium]